MYRFFGYVFETIYKVTNLLEKKRKTFTSAISFRNVGKSALLRYKSNRNLIRAYSTTNHKSAYEKLDECTSIYVSALKKYLGEKMPILAVLNRVNAGKNKNKHGYLLNSCAIYYTRE